MADLARITIIRYLKNVTDDVYYNVTFISPERLLHE